MSVTPHGTHLNRRRLPLAAVPPPVDTPPGRVGVARKNQHRAAKDVVDHRQHQVCFGRQPAAGAPLQVDVRLERLVEVAGHEQLIPGIRPPASDADGHVDGVGPADFVPRGDLALMRVRGGPLGFDRMRRNFDGAVHRPRLAHALVDRKQPKQIQGGIPLVDDLPAGPLVGQAREAVIRPVQADAAFDLRGLEVKRVVRPAGCERDLLIRPAAGRGGRGDRREANRRGQCPAENRNSGRLQKPSTRCHRVLSQDCLRNRFSSYSNRNLQSLYRGPK